MLKTIQQSVVLPASPARLYAMYLNPKTHVAITGEPAKIDRKRGAVFRAFEGTLTGTILQTVPNKLIVQSWRASYWKKSDLDSTLILSFQPDPKGGRIHLVHVNVPDHDYEGVKEGWFIYYWRPWRNYLIQK
jgi:activator of HSP90 ATPase